MSSKSEVTVLSVVPFAPLKGNGEAFTSFGSKIRRVANVQIDGTKYGLYVFAVIKANEYSVAAYAATRTDVPGEMQLVDLYGKRVYDDIEHAWDDYASVHTILRNCVESPDIDLIVDCVRSAMNRDGSPSLRAWSAMSHFITD